MGTTPSSRKGPLEAKEKALPLNSHTYGPSNSINTASLLDSDISDFGFNISVSSPIPKGLKEQYPMKTSVSDPLAILDIFLDPTIPMPSSRPKNSKEIPRPSGAFNRATNEAVYGPTHHAATHTKESKIREAKTAYLPSENAHFKKKRDDTRMAHASRKRLVPQMNFKPDSAAMTAFRQGHEPRSK